MSIIETLTEGIVNRDMKKEGAALLNKWSKTGLLEGLQTEREQAGMARLLENQAKELLREANTMAGGDVEGFAAVAFPIVRRVFAGLIANDLVSVQPMSLPSGLIFFLDFSFDRERMGNNAAQSLYGGDQLASGIADGVTIDGIGDDRDRGAYNLNNGYSSPTGSAAGNALSTPAVATGTSATYGAAASTDKVVRFDPDFVSGSTEFCTITMNASSMDQLNLKNLVAINVSSSYGNGIISGSTAASAARLVRRLTSYNASTGKLTFVFTGTGSLGEDGTLSAAQLLTAVDGGADLANNTWSWPQTDDITAGSATGAVVGQAVWGLENESNIPEIDIKVDSIAITAVTKKLKAKWTPELGQDLNA